MRAASCLFALTLLSPLVLSTPAAAQQPSAMPACAGAYNTVRVSEIKPEMMDTFLQAVAAQKAWYKKAGTTDQISVMRVIDRKTGTYSTTEALTTHTQAVGTTRAPGDAGFDAFVALFNKSSTIKMQYVTCEEK
jgi:hypothetical protein